ncbi:hypothetical protein GIY23_18820 [Allosaccharopolyspora coralli]|uniref:CopG family transcriptional regulator n=1 Tax=Allosaccharopolyspora coralli TaxID=2665642 RepID=A0A5Q3Q9D2_9PSEU|nr:hypothetical protein [Allosaccharopolyspora coralli]QGK71301.1 hypothetical protein GIY23_18820 [Allosaccharopolyspora coralli]
MPTTRPRHHVTETDDLAAALDAEAGRRPDLSRSQLLVQLALEGHQAAEHAHGQCRSHKLAALRKHSGVLTGAYETGHRDRLRDEWPE